MKAVQDLLNLVRSTLQLAEQLNEQQKTSERYNQRKNQIKRLQNLADEQASRLNKDND